MKQPFLIQKEACENAQQSMFEHFVDVNKTSPMPNGGVKTIDDMMLSRYACYLIVMNGDPRKEVIALGQTYFAVKTRQQELIEQYDRLTEDQKRLVIRNEVKEHNKLLNIAAKDAGVKTGMDYAIFQNAGYQGLYGGLKATVRRTIAELGGTMPEELPTPEKSIKEIEKEQKQLG